MTTLPLTPLGEVFDITSSKRVFQSEWRSSGVPFYRAREIVRLSNDGFVDNELFISQDMYDEYASKHGVPKPGDLLVTGVGTLGVCYVVRSGDRFYFKDGNIIWLKNRGNVCPRYVKYSFGIEEVKRQVNRAAGTTVGTFTIERAKATKIPLPPLSEQKRIADILDKADAIRRKRQAAIKGLLSIPGSAFYEMFGSPFHNKKGWEIGTIRDLVAEVKYGSSGKAGATGDFPMLRMNNITYSGAWDFSELKYIDVPEKDHPKYLVQKGDLLFNRTNSKELVGKTAVFQEDTPMAYAGYLVRARTNERSHPDYIAGYLNSPHGKATLRHMCKNIVGMANINAQELQDILIPHPPIEAQLEYVRLLDGVRQSETPLRNALTEAEALFGSLVQRAFKGKL